MWKFKFCLKSYIFILIFISTIFKVSAVNYYTSSPGNWTAASRWTTSSPGGFWNLTDTVFVDHAMTLNTNIGFNGVLIIRSGGSISGTNSIQGNNSSKIISVGNISVSTFSLSTNASLSTTGSVTTTGGFTAGGTGNVNIGGNLTVGGNLSENTSGSFILNGNLSVTGSATIQGGGTTTISGDITTGTMTLNGASTLNTASGKNFTVNGALNLNDSSILNNAANLTVSGNMNQNSTSQFNNSGNATVNGNYQKNNTSSALITGSLYVVNDFLSYGGTTTINGNMFVGNNNGSVAGQNGSTINGNGNFIVDGTFNNYGTISGNLNVCNSAGTGSPISSSPPAGTVTVCGPGSPLPVSLISFDATIENNTIKLDWATLSEQNNFGFYIEKAGNDKNFQHLDFVEGNNYSNQLIDYSFIDNDPFDGLNIYKLIQQDFDGTSTQIGYLSVNFSNQNVDFLNVYPNPNNGIFNISLHSKRSSNNVLNIVNTKGISVYSEVIKLEGNLIIKQIDLSQIPKGFYYIIVQNEYENISKNISIQ